MESSKIIFLQRPNKSKIFQQKKKIPLTLKKPKSYLIFRSKKKKIISLYLICLLIFAIFELLLTILMTDLTHNIIGELISTGLILFLSLTYILTSLNKWKRISYCLTWCIFISFFSQIIVVQLSFGIIEDKSGQIFNLFKHKIYLYTMISHSSLCLLMKYSVQWRCIHHLVMIVFDIGGMIGLCVIAKRFMFESVYILFIHTFIIFIELISINYSSGKKKGGLDFSNGVESTLCQELELGYAQCLGNNFEIIQKNEVMTKRYQKLIQIKQHYNKKASLIKGKEIQSNNTTNKESNPTLAIPVSNSMNSTDIMNNEPKQYFNVKDFYQKIEYDCLNGQNKKREELKISLEEMILKKIEVCKINNKFGVFQCLGKFKYKKDSFSLHSIIYLRIAKNQTKTKYFYEFIIIETDPPKEKKKTKENYENLLKKISHELRYPNMNIQKIVENIIKENITSKFSSISSMKDYQANILLTTSTLEQLKLIKYLSEISLLTVRDIIEHSALQKKEIEQEDKDNDNRTNTNNNEEEGKETRNKASNLDMDSFIRYINEISRSYLYLYNKNQEFKLNIQDIIYSTQIIIDEQKLSQIISNLLTNAIKNTSEHTPIVLSINTILETDLKSQKCQTLQIPKIPGQSVEQSQASLLSMRENKLRDENNNVIAGISIEIEDYGKGIDSDVMNDINNAKRDTKLKPSNDYSVAKGFGAGLQICKKLCEEMNIKLKCELITKQQKIISSTNLVNQFGVSMMENNNQLQQQVIGTKFILSIEGEVISKKSNKKNTLESTCIEMNNILIEPSDKKILHYEDNTNGNGNGEGGDDDDIDSPFFNYNPNMLYHQTSINKKSCIRKQTSKIYISEETAVNIKKKSMTSIPTIKSKKTVPKELDIEVIKPPKVSDSHIIKNNYSMKNKPFAIKTINTNQNSLIQQGNKKNYLSQIGIGIGIDSLNDSNCSDEFFIGVLIVDDDANVTDTVRNLVATYCKKMNIRNKITILNDGIELIYALYTESQVNNATTKLIFCDEMMKFINGSDAFMLLKKYFGTIIKNIMFVSMSAFSDIVHKQKLNELGVDLIYEKPITKGQIDFIFDQLIKRKVSV